MAALSEPAGESTWRTTAPALAETYTSSQPAWPATVRLGPAGIAAALSGGCMAASEVMGAGGATEPRRDATPTTPTSRPTSIRVRARSPANGGVRGREIRNPLAHAATSKATRTSAALRSRMRPYAEVMSCSGRRICPTARMIPVATTRAALASATEAYRRTAWPICSQVADRSQITPTRCANIPTQSAATTT